MQCQLVTGFYMIRALTERYFGTDFKINFYIILLIFQIKKDGVPRGSILGPLFFNIHICDLFYIMRNWPVANYTDDTTPYTGGKNTQDVITSLENCALILFKWFENNLMKANSDKSHLLLSTSTPSTANINGDIIKNSESEKLLGVTID